MGWGGHPGGDLERYKVEGCHADVVVVACTDKEGVFVRGEGGGEDVGGDVEGVVVRDGFGIFFADGDNAPGCLRRTCWLCFSDNL